MNAQPNFGSILDKASGEIERPKPIPQGSYICVIKGEPRQDKSPKKGTEFVEFTLVPQSALEDVDQEALQEMGGLADKSLKLTFYLTENSIYRLKDFLSDDLGFELEEDKGLRPYLHETINQGVGVKVKHTPSEDGKSVYANIASTFRVE